MAFGSTKRKRIDDSTAHAHEHEVEEIDRDKTSNDDRADAGDQSEKDGCEEDNPASGAENPILSEVTFLKTKPKGKNDGGSKDWQCNHCKKTYKSSSTRIMEHFFGSLQKGRKTSVARCSVLLNDRAKYKELYDKVKMAEEKGPSSKSKVAVAPAHPGKITDAFGIMERDAVDKKILMCLAANGVPFQILRSPFFTEMVTAINNAPKGYKAPSSEKARTTLLDACKRQVENDLSGVKDTWLTQGVSIVSDGWTNIKNQALINVVASNSSGSCFLYAEDYSGIEKTGHEIAQFLLEAFDDIGPMNVLQVVTDNASNCKAAGREIQKVHPHIFWTPCVAHTLNLIFKDFAKKFPWMEQTYKSGKAIVNFFQSPLGV